MNEDSINHTHLQTPVINKEHIIRDISFLNYLYYVYIVFLLFYSLLIGTVYLPTGILTAGFGAVLVLIKKRFKQKWVTSTCLLLPMAILFFSRLLWQQACSILPEWAFFALQAIFYISFVFGLAALYAFITQPAPSELRSVFIARRIAHGLYFIMGLIIIPYTWLYAYGILSFVGWDSSLIFPFLILLGWIILYILQMKCIRLVFAAIPIGVFAVILAGYIVVRWFVIMS